jgi:hypothetical protein
VTMIVHRCSKCRRVDFWCEGTTVEPVGEREGQRVCCKGATWTEPEVIPTWLIVTGRTVTDLLPPGGKAPGGARSCDCADCRALYEARRVVTVQPAGGVL